MLFFEKVGRHPATTGSRGPTKKGQKSFLTYFKKILGGRTQRGMKVPAGLPPPPPPVGLGKIPDRKKKPGRAPVPGAPSPRPPRSQSMSA